ncbi:MAG: lipid asymmetry maintenance protein MlaB [Gammaproteobacteria bacterium]
MNPRTDAGKPAPLEVTARDGAIALAGALVFDTVPDALARSLALLPANGELIFDLGAVTHADSAALALIVEWRRAATRRGAALELRGLPSQLRALAAATGLEELVR